MAKAEKMTENTGIILVLAYVVTYVVSALVVYLANMYFPAQVVLGTMSMSSWWAIFHSVSMLSLILTFAIPFLHHLEHLKGRDLTPVEWMVKYYVLNFVGLWVITRFSDQFGLGVSSWMVIAVLAAILDLVQGVAMIALEKFRLSQR